MEALLLDPTGRRTPSDSVLLLGVTPALLPRMSRTELGLLGGLRSTPRPVVLPVGAPADALVDQIQLRAALLRFYLDLMPRLDRSQRHGVEVLCDVAAVMHLEPWIRPSTVAEAIRPLRELVGPEDELGLGPACDDVLQVLEGIADVAGSAHRVRALTDSWSRHPEDHWDAIAYALLVCANMTARQASLRMVARITSVANDTVRTSPVVRAIRLRAAAIILADAVDARLVLAASEPWLAGYSADPTNGRA